MRSPSVAGAVGWGLASAGLVAGARPLADNSLFTHVATGRLITASGIPRTDPYTFTAAGEPWVVQSWLVSTLYGVVERVAGLGGVRVAGGLLLAAVLALAWHLTAPARALVPRLGLVALVIATSHPFWSPRPLLLGLVLLGLVLVVVLPPPEAPAGGDGPGAGSTGAPASPAGRASPASPGASAGAARPAASGPVTTHDARTLVPIMWTWVNAHGSFVLGPAVVACLCLGRYLDGDRRRQLWHPLGWALAGTLAGAVNPLGPVLLVFPVQILDRMDVLARVVEWRSPDFGELHTRAFLVQVALAVLLLVRRPSYRVAVPLVAFTAAALLGQRSIPHASLVLLPGLATGLAGLGRLDGRERPRALIGVVAVVVVLALVLTGAVLRRPHVDLRTYPVAALAWVEERAGVGRRSGTGRGADGEGGEPPRLAAPDTTGNLLGLLHGRDAHVFFDDRYDMFPRSVSRDYLDLHDGTPRWDEVLDDHGIAYVLWPRMSPLASLLASSPVWRVLYQDGTAFVACRRGRAPSC